MAKAAGALPPALGAGESAVLLLVAGCWLLAAAAAAGCRRCELRAAASCCWRGRGVQNERHVQREARAFRRAHHALGGHRRARRAAGSARAQPLQQRAQDLRGRSRRRDSSARLPPDSRPSVEGRGFPRAHSVEGRSARARQVCAAFGLGAGLRAPAGRRAARTPPVPRRRYDAADTPRSRVAAKAARGDGYL